MIGSIAGKARFKCECCGQGYELADTDIQFKVRDSVADNTLYVAEVSELCMECSADIEIQFQVWVDSAGGLGYTTEESYGVESLIAQYRVITSQLVRSVGGVLIC